MGIFRWRRYPLRRREAPIFFYGPPPPRKEASAWALADPKRVPRWRGSHSRSSSFASATAISRPTYHRLRSQGLGPTEMRIGLNLVRISADAEREWQRRLQKPQRDFEARALERAVKAGDAAAKSSKHISKRGRGRQ